MYEGPSLLAPHPVVAAEFGSPFTTRLPSGDVVAVLRKALPSGEFAALECPQGDLDFAHASALVAGALHDLAGPCGLPVELRTAGDGRSTILLGFRDPLTAMAASRTALQIVHTVFARADVGAADIDAIGRTIRNARRLMRNHQPDYIDRAMMRVAEERGIPVQRVSPGSRTWRYGQGSAGLVFCEAGSQLDSLIGGRLTQNKLLCNQWVTRLGLPGVEHAVASSAAHAVDIAERLGWPVVAKPLDGGKGAGVTANIGTPGELARAFEGAAAVSGQGVLVERFMPGDDHRMAVIGGTLKWVVRRTPPRVFGDGEATVEELIERENANRRDADVAAGFVTRLEIDGDMLDVLAKQGLTLGDRPTKNRSVRLRTVANTATGGTISDCTDRVHPDNRAMAETIARNLRMDALGIDFMTTDIAQSWCEVPSAVIEVNALPGFSSDGRAAIILEDKFPAGTDGRIPSVVLVGADASLAERASAALAAGGPRVGLTDGGATRLDGQPRCRPADPLPARVNALLLDASCDAVVIRMTEVEFVRYGFPLDRCDVAVIAGTQPSAGLADVLARCAGTVVGRDDGGDPLDPMLTAIEQVRARRNNGRAG